MSTLLENIALGTMIAAGLATFLHQGAGFVRSFAPALPAGKARDTANVVADDLDKGGDVVDRVAAAASQITIHANAPNAVHVAAAPAVTDAPAPTGGTMPAAAPVGPSPVDTKGGAT